MKSLNLSRRSLQAFIRKFWSSKRSSKMPGFDREFYLAHNADVAASGTDPLKHYLEHGWREGREPSAGFTGQRYLAFNPDVQLAGINPLIHYLNHGLAEGRAGVNGIGDSTSLRQVDKGTSSPPILQSTSLTSSGTIYRQQTRLL